MAIPWSTPKNSSRGENRDSKQVQREKLDRASRLLLGAMIEAYDVLSQLQAEMGCDVEENENIPVLRQFVEDINTHSQTISYLSQQTPKLEEKCEEESQSNTELTESPGPVEEREEKPEGGDEEDSKCPEVSLPDIVPVLTSSLPPLPPLPALPDLIPSSKKTPKISCRARKAERRPRGFRLTTLSDPELHRTKKYWSSAQLTWREVGTKLSELSRYGEKPARPTQRRRSNVTEVVRNNHNPSLNSDQPDCTPTPPPLPDQLHQTDLNSGLMINNVLKVVQVFGLFLIVKKFENLLK